MRIRQHSQESLWVLSDYFRGQARAEAIVDIFIRLLCFRYLATVGLRNFSDTAQAARDNKEEGLSRKIGRLELISQEQWNRMSDTATKLVTEHEQLVPKPKELSDSFLDGIYEAFAQMEKSLNDIGRCDFTGVLSSFELGDMASSAAPKGMRPTIVAMVVNLINQSNLSSENEYSEALDAAFDTRFQGLERAHLSPAGLSSLIAQIAFEKRQGISSIYDGTAGTGAILGNLGQLAKESHPNIYGQEINELIKHYCVIRLLLRGFPISQFQIARGNTLSNPADFESAKFDAIVMNIPIGLKWLSEGDNVNNLPSSLSVAGQLPPRMRGDLAFVLHALDKMASDAVAVLTVMPSSLFGIGAEKSIRSYLLKQNVVDTVIQLPAGILRPLAGVPLNIIVLKKNRATNQVRFVDAHTFGSHISRNGELDAPAIDEIVRLTSAVEPVGTKVAFSSTDNLILQDSDLTVRKQFPAQKMSTSSLLKAIKSILNSDLKELSATSRVKLQQVAVAIQERTKNDQLKPEDIAKVFRLSRGSTEKNSALLQEHLNEIANKAQLEVELVKDVATQFGEDVYKTRRTLLRERTRRAHVSAVLRPLDDDTWNSWASYRAIEASRSVPSSSRERLIDYQVADVPSLLKWADAVFDLFAETCVSDDKLHYLTSTPFRARALQSPELVSANSERIYRQDWRFWIRLNATRILNFASTPLTSSERGDNQGTARLSNQFSARAENSDSEPGSRTDAQKNFVIEIILRAQNDPERLYQLSIKSQDNALTQLKLWLRSLEEIDDLVPSDFSLNLSVSRGHDESKLVMQKLTLKNAAQLLMNFVKGNA